jgi:hypothetical protein
MPSRVGPSRDLETGVRAISGVWHRTRSRFRLALHR